MTVIKVDLRRTLGEGTRLAGDVTVEASWTVLQFAPDDEPVVLTTAVRYWELEDGVGVIKSEPTPIGNGLSLRIYGGGLPSTIALTVAVPDEDEVDLTALARLDPKTLDPTAEPEAAWWAATADAIAQAAAALAAAVAAAGDADDAATSAAAALEQASAAAQAAGTAQASASAAATSAQASITSGTVTGDNLILTRLDGGTVDAGNVRGAKGDKGDAGPWASTDLGTTDLNTVITPGAYRQPSTANATLARNYPAAPSGGAWTLEVQRSGTVDGIVQRMYRTWAADAGRVQWVRTLAAANGTWSAWRPIATQRVDTTAGRAIYTWDVVNDREQLIYGDTGLRDLSSLLPAGWSGPFVLSRYGSQVEVSFNLTPPSDLGDSRVQVLAIPVGFRGAFSGTHYTRHRYSLDTREGYSVLQNATLGVGALNGTAYNAAYGSIAGRLSWRTTDSWPAALPGVASGTIPNT